MNLFESLGFTWDRKNAAIELPVHSKNVVAFSFHKNMAEFIWDAAMLEGNPCTLPQVQTIMSGVTVGGIKISDQEQVINLFKSCKELHKIVKEDRFVFSRQMFLHLHSILAKEEALEWGVFRGEGQETNYTPHVALGNQGTHEPLPTLPGAKDLISTFEKGLAAIEKHCSTPFERGAAFFLFGALQQFFFDGNKRTSRLMMNGVLMSHGHLALSIHAKDAQEFNERMVGFYKTKEASPMFEFLANCHPDFKQSESLKKNPSLSATPRP